MKKPNMFSDGRSSRYSCSIYGMGRNTSMEAGLIECFELEELYFGANISLVPSTI